MEISFELNIPAVDVRLVLTYHDAWKLLPGNLPKFKKSGVRNQGLGTDE